METERYPIDPEAYERGDLIPRDVVMRAVGIRDIVTADDAKAFSVGKLRIIEFLRDQPRFHGVSIRSEGEGIRIIADGIDQHQHCEREKRRALRMFARRHMEHCSVSPELLGDDEQRRWRERVVRDSSVLQFAREQRRLPPLRKQDPPAIASGE